MIAAALPITTLLSFGDSGYGDELAWAALRTIEISVFGYGFGIALGLGGALGKIAGPLWLKRALGLYTTLFRALPELILIMLLYYAGTDGLNRLLSGVGLGPFQLNGLIASIFVLAIVQGAYATEVLRAAISAVPIGQLEAASAMGMSAALRFRRITVPAMLPLALPGLANLWLNITKDSALVSIVGYTELALATQQAAGVSKQYFVIYLVAQGIYLTISLTSVWLFGRLEKNLRRGQSLARAAA